MIMLRSTVTLIFLVFFLNARASFDFNANCISAYKEIVSLRVTNARVLIDAEKKKNPNNSIPYLLDNYADYFCILTSENKALFSKLKTVKTTRLNRIENDDEKSPYYLFALAEIHLQLALTHGFFQEYFNSSLELNKAYRILQENDKKYPNFLPNKKGLGMINAVLGSLPDGLKRTASFIGIKGNTQAGVRMLEKLVSDLPKSPYAHFYDEAAFSLAYVRTDILNDHSAYSKIFRDAQRIDTSSLLRSYIISYSAMRTAHINDAITALNQRPKGNEYLNYDYLDYLAGVVRMRKLDATASTHFGKFLQNYSGINYVKDTYLNLAWLALLSGNNKAYYEHIQLVLTKGNTLHEKDKQALQEARDPMPDKELLRARLLFDGGFYERSFDEIKDRRAGDFKILRDKIEFCYRLGRIYDEMNKDDSALKFYQFALDLGEHERYYFASNAALRIAGIYEKNREYPKARTYYNTAINMKGHDYERSIESKAKEGLRRIGG